MVTGCAGFVGAHLCARLVAGGWQVVGIDALRPYYGAAEKLDALSELRRNDLFQFVQADLVEHPLSESVTFRGRLTLSDYGSGEDTTGGSLSASGGGVGSKVMANPS